ncbi:Cof-type HAD-IIB family hydrolase [Lichenifustis flavocetrariae]|uniref:Cof-type HAD-IIB family hydrolase n=1 Tax=Lichenifustis flavocetrariae TaxID=2949735 RepID=A0AA42CIL8_9HYPH|nr:Cof-type HAD-IIB family hydrolase [Lichenifustis flavocetrariae]MCW6508703.1 Cof-type HAD-IIB family hydrolase [Lichenifustis flavocetrariae]
MTDKLPKIPIALVVSDVDGTLVTRDKRVTPRARAAVENLRRQGIYFTIMSARPPVGVSAIVRALDLPGPIGAVNGGALIRGDLSVIERLYMPAKAARESVAFIRRHGIDAWLFTDTEWFLRDPEGAHVEHEKKTLGMDFTVVDEFDDAHFDQALKIVAASHDHPLLERLEAELQALLGPHASATRSQTYYLDVTHPEAIKGFGLLGIARLLDIPPEAVLAIGDGVNDITMLQQAGFAVAMGNANDLVKKHATVITGDCDQEGFAEAIETFVLADPRRAERLADEDLAS